MQSSMTIDDAIEAQRRIGQTAAQHQSTSPGDFVRRANADARASLDASRARPPADPATGLQPVDISHIDPDHLRGMSHALSAPIRRATSRVGAIFPLAATHILALEKALKEEIAMEFWALGDSMHRDYEDFRGDLIDELQAGTAGGGGLTPTPTPPVEAGGTPSTSATVSGGETPATSGTVDSGGTSSTSGTVDNGGSVTNTGTVDNAGTAGA